MGGVGRITGTVIGAVILGLIKSGFTFIGVDSYIQDIIKGVIIVSAVAIDMHRNRKNDSYQPQITHDISIRKQLIYSPKRLIQQDRLYWPDCGLGAHPIWFGRKCLLITIYVMV